MRVIVDFENGLLQYNSKIINQFVNLKNKIFNIKEEANCIPYNSQVINILVNYKNYEIVLYVNDKRNLNRATYIKEDLNSLDIIIHQIIMKYDYDPREKDELITKNLSLVKKYKHIPSSYIGNIFNYIYYMIIASKSIDSRNMIFGGFLSIFWRHWQIIVPIISIWPVLFILLNLNLNIMNSAYISSMGFCGAFGIFRSLLEINNEYKNFTQGYESRVSDLFVYYGYSINAAYINMILFGILTLLKFNIYGYIIGLIFGLTYFYFYCASAWRRIIALSCVSFCLHSIFSFKFVVQFLKDII